MKTLFSMNAERGEKKPPPLEYACRLRFVDPLIWFILVFSCTLCLATEPASLNNIMDDLGAKDFRQRKAAKQELLALGKSDPISMIEQVDARLATEKDPEIRLNLEELVEDLASLPMAEIPFGKLPLRRGWWELQKPSGQGTFRFMKDGTLEFDSMPEQEDVLIFAHRVKEPPDERYRLVIDAEIRVLKEQRRPGQTGMMITIEDHQPAYPLMIRGGRIFFYDKASTQYPEYFFMDTMNEFHHYRYVVEGNQQHIYVDEMEKPKLTATRPAGEGRNWAAFGDNSGTSAAKVQVRKLRFSRQLITERKPGP